MSQRHVVLAVLICVGILHVVTEGEATVKLIKQWR